MASFRAAALALAMACAWASAAAAEGFAEFNSKGLPGSEGIVVRVRHPAGWKKVPIEDALAIAELRGTQGRLAGILQVGRGQHRSGVDALCAPDRARTMLQKLSGDESDTRVTDVVARKTDGRAGYEIRYERNHAPDFLVVRSAIVCLKNSRVLVSCGAEGTNRAALAGIEPVCRQVLDSVRIAED
jgi:hypothetical protein